MATKRLGKQTLWIQRLVLFAYIIFMAWVIVWKLNYHPDIWLSQGDYWKHAGESANDTITVLEALNGR